MQHLYWLGAHEIVSMKSETRDKLGMWSCRFWMVYVVLYFAQLKEEYEDLMHHRQMLSDKLKKDVTLAEKDEIKKKLKGSEEELKLWTVNTLINAAYLPLTVVCPAAVSLRLSNFPIALVVGEQFLPGHWRRHLWLDRLARSIISCLESFRLIVISLL